MDHWKSSRAGRIVIVISIKNHYEDYGCKLSGNSAKNQWNVSYFSKQENDFVAYNISCTNPVFGNGL